MDNECPPGTSPRPPQRGRRAYPAHLARAGDAPRTPLHRRGTSQKLECLEDLLREAGFKETRIFTPEAEREAGRKKQATSEIPGKGNINESMTKKNSTGLVKFLSGLVPWADIQDGKRMANGWHAKTQSLGKVAGKTKQALLSEENEQAMSTDESSELPTTPTPRHRKPITPIILTSDFSSPGSASSTFSRSPPKSNLQPLLRHSSRSRLNKPSKSSTVDARSSLRHMISMPAFVSPSGTSRPSHRFSRRVTENAVMPVDGLRQVSNALHLIPPISKAGTIQQGQHKPHNWLGSDTYTVLGTTNPGVQADETRIRPQGRRQPRSQTSRAILTSPVSRTQCAGEYTRRDGSLARRGFAPRTPRSDTTPGIVTPASVVCRSAPGSRSSSLVRNSRTHGRRDCRRHDICLPSLGVSSVELADSGTTMGNDTGHDSPEENYEGDSSDDGDLDFARLIVPARRQHSIQSLRRHLHKYVAASGVSENGKPPPSAYARVSKGTNHQAGLGARPGSRLSGTFESISDTIRDADGLDKFMRSRRISTGEDSDDRLLAEWATHGLPGLENAVHRKRGALPWTSRAQHR